MTSRCVSIDVLKNGPLCTPTNTSSSPVRHMHCVALIESVTLAIMAVPTRKTIINDADAKQVHQVATSGCQVVMSQLMTQETVMKGLFTLTL